MSLPLPPIPPLLSSSTDIVAIDMMTACLVIGINTYIITTDTIVTVTVTITGVSTVDAVDITTTQNTFKLILI